MKNDKAAFNIRGLYAYSFFWMFLVIMPVIIPYYLKLGFSMQQVFLLQVVFGTSTLLLEVPSGYLADLWGRKNTLVCGALLYALGYAWLYYARSFIDFLALQVILGGAMSLASGTDLALLYGWINTRSVPERAASTNIIANRQLAQVGSESLAALAGGVLVFWSFQWVLGVQAIMALMPLCVALCLTEAPYERMGTDHKGNIRAVYAHIFVKDPFLRLLFFNMMLWSLSTFIAVWTFQKYWQDIGIPLRYFGVLWAVYNLTVGIVGKRAQKLEARLGSARLIHLLSGLSITGFLALAGILALFPVYVTERASLIGYVLTALALLAGLCFQISRGITGVTLREAFNWRIPDRFRATANSVSSMAFRLGFALLGPLMGWMIDHLGLSVALALMGCFYILVYGVLSRPLAARLNLNLTNE